VRAFHCLSLGTPLISERSPLTRPDAPFDQAVTWFDDCSLETFFGQTFGTPAYYQHARQQLQGWKQHDPVDAYADLMAFAAGYLQGHAKGKPQQAWRPTQVNLGSGKDYKAGWLNLDVIDRTEPDLVLDLGKPQDFPVKAVTRFGTEMVLEAGSVDKVCANNVLQKSSDLGRLMSNTLKLLTKGGTFEIEVPYEQAATAWQDPTHLRAMNENSWIYYTQWFWYLGWFEHRFEMVSSEWLDLKLVPCAREQAAFMKVTLQKIETSAYERTIARTMQSGLDDFDAGLNDSAVTDVAAEEEAANLAHSPETRWGAVSRNLLNA
jgi:SAM-dependent methyltransferase